MPVYSYAAVDNLGKRITGNIEATDRDEVVASLQERDLIITKITEGAEKTTKSQQAGQRKIYIIPPRVSSDDLMIFTRELATMINAGLPLVECLYSLAEDIDNVKLRNVIHDMGSKIIAGKSFSDALAFHRDVFDNMYINLVKVGEMGGNLEKILQRLAEYIEATVILKKKVMAAMYYPVTILVFAFLVMSGLFIFIIPRFASIFKGFGSELPAPTQFFLDTATFMQKYYVIIFLVILGTIVILSKVLKTPKGQVWFDQLKLSVPLIGPLVKKIVIARFSRTLALLYSSGVSIVDSLDLVASSCGNVIVEKAVLIASEQVLEGERITGTLEKSKIFPNMVIHMIDVGERTGSLSTMLQKISDFYEMQVNASINGLTSIIEPILIVLMGVFIGVIAVCLFLPIVKLPQIIGQ
ncbi:MAG: type II secretion system F family protein [Candidatus Eremiobacteraeota bacterium]|nr:type II secretion system F family protein [Candidatus Eremiobacteraeota bacterium]